MGRKKNKPIEITWNGKKVLLEFKGVSWLVIPLEGQYISSHEKLKIIKAVNYG